MKRIFLFIQIQIYMNKLGNYIFYCALSYAAINVGIWRYKLERDFRIARNNLNVKNEISKNEFNELMRINRILFYKEIVKSAAKVIIPSSLQSDALIKYYQNVKTNYFQQKVKY